MGDSIKAIYEAYDDYVYICEKLNIKPLGIRDDRSFLDHEDEIFKKYNVKNIYEFNRKVKL